MAQAVSHQHITAEAWVRSWDSLCEIFGGQNGTQTDFSKVLQFSSFSIIPPMLHTHLHLHVALARRAKPGDVPKSSVHLEIKKY
jgi:hypothetical protein